LKPRRWLFCKFPVRLYDDITVDLKINGLDRQIRIRRVGVDIVAYEWEEEASDLPQYLMVSEQYNY
jgi:hypothetical protein